MYSNGIFKRWEILEKRVRFEGGIGCGRLNPPLPQFSRLGIQVSGNCLFVCLTCRCVLLFRVWVGVSFFSF